MVQRAKRMEHGAKDSGIIIAKGWRTSPSGLEAAGCTSSEAYLNFKQKTLGRIIDESRASVVR